jgi:hypothetical protein
MNSFLIDGAGHRHRRRQISFLKITPAMAAGVTSKLWEMSDMVAILEAWESAKAAA